MRLPDGEQMSIYDAAMKYRDEGVPLIVLGGKEDGSGSSRDWAAKGTLLLGVRAVLVESFERIHRSNLIGMGVLPLVFKPGESVDTLGPSGREVFTIEGLSDQITPRSEVTVHARREDGSALIFKAIVRLETPIEVYYCGVGVAKGNYTLRDWLNVAIFELHKTGWVDEAWKKWLGGPMVFGVQASPYF